MSVASTEIVSDNKFWTTIQKSKPKAVLPTPVVSKLKGPAESFSWWNPANVFPRPWEDDQDESASVPTEQKQLFAQTRDVCVNFLSLFYIWNDSFLLLIRLFATPSKLYVAWLAQWPWRPL
jgi:hypothetical protein